MFRQMRRKEQILSLEENIKILNNQVSGVLALIGDEDYPYTVPINYVYSNLKIYFHGAKSGHKIDAIKNHNKASFCVIDYEQIVPEKYTTYYRSVIAFGKIQIIENEKKSRNAIEMLATKYSPDYKENLSSEIEKMWKSLCMLELFIEHLTGKASMELIRNKI